MYIYTYIYIYIYIYINIYNSDSLLYTLYINFLHIIAFSESFTIVPVPDNVSINIHDDVYLNRITTKDTIHPLYGHVLAYLNIFYIRTFHSMHLYYAHIYILFIIQIHEMVYKLILGLRCMVFIYNTYIYTYIYMYICIYIYTYIYAYIYI
jgi:hypothetical protein